MRLPIITVKYYDPILDKDIEKLLWVVDIPSIGESFTVYLKEAPNRVIHTRVEDVQWTGCDDRSACGEPEVTIVLDVK